jgi:exonuclease SbcD
VRIVHLADTHLGYRAYHRVTRDGVNLRERDVARAFREAVDRTIELRPELVVVAGDVFDRVRPSNAAITDAFAQFARLRAALPDTPVVVIAGNHDTPRSADVGNILRLFAAIPGLHVAHHEARRFAFPELDAAVLALPHNALAGPEPVAVEPDPAYGVNVCVAHAEVDDPRLRFGGEYGGARLARDALDPGAWTYVALGHYHLYTPLAPNAAYAGSTERTAPNLWEEAAAPKGFVEFDVAAGTQRFHALESPRRVLDLGPLDAAGRTAEQLDEALHALLDGVEDGIDDAIVRVRILNCPRAVWRQVDHRRIRDARARAVHLQLDVQPPELVRTEASGAPGQRATLAEEVEAFLRHRWTPRDPEVDRTALVGLGLEILREVGEAASAEG